MDSPVSKISFIPKSPLAREENFFERKRPRSAIGILAITIVTIVVGSYAGLYYYDFTLAKEIITKTKEINDLQNTFNTSEQVAIAKTFRSRAELAKELLAEHVVISPVFDFLSEATLQSILYENFSFKKSATGWTLDLTGEAPSYAALAYQADVLRKKTKELSSFSIKNVALTKFGSVTFALSLVFLPDYISYTNSSAFSDVPSGQSASDQSEVIATTTSKVLPQEGQSSATSSAVATVESGGWSTISEATTTVGAKVTTATSSVATAQKQSALRSLWEKFKFW